MLHRLLTTWRIVGRTFGTWVSPLITALAISALRVTVILGQLIDPLLFSRLRRTRVQRPIVIVGNPRTGTTFLHRFLHDHQVATGQKLWRMLYASLTVQLFVKPLLPLLEKFSPTRHHSAAAHKTGLTMVETDDASVLFRYFDGFFLYGFFWAFDEADHLSEFDPRVRDTSQRDFDWLEAGWRRTLAAEDGQRIVAKLFSLGPRLPRFTERFPDARVLYMARDPVQVMPSAMSLVTGVLDARWGFWKLPEDVRARYLEKLYGALLMLLQRFHEDWTSGRIDRDKVMVVRFDRLMQDFEGLMAEILDFLDVEPSPELLQAIRERGEKQRAYKSGHSYDLATYGLTEERIREDTAFFTDTFLPPLDP